MYMTEQREECTQTGMQNPGRVYRKSKSEIHYIRNLKQEVKPKSKSESGGDLTRKPKRDTMPIVKLKGEFPMGDFDQIKYITEYNKQNYDTITFRVPKGTKSEWKSIIDRTGKSLNAFIVEAVEDKIESLTQK